MSAKPSSTYQWATSGPISVPTSGKQAAGFAAGERGAAQYFDWLLNGAGLWAQYLNDGALSGAFSFDSTMSIADTLTMGANKNIIISGTGQYKRGTNPRKIPAAAGKNTGGSFPADGSGYLDGRWKSTAAGDLLVIPFVVNVNERLTQIIAEILGDTVEQVSMKIYKTSAFAGAAQLGGTQTSATAASAQALTVSGLTEAVATGDTWYMATFKTTGTAAGSLQVGGIEVTTDVP